MIIVLRKVYLLFICGFLISGTILAQTQPPVNPKYKEFNFWKGEWDVYKTGTDTIVGKSKIKVILGNMAVRENYKSRKSKYKGTSLNKYNENKGKWEQFWVDNGGLTLHLEGGREGNKMIMQTASGSAGSTIDKISWEKKEDGTVQQIWLQSKDQKKTWTTLFDGTYVKVEKKKKGDGKKGNGKKGK